MTVAVLRSPSLAGSASALRGAAGSAGASAVLVALFMFIGAAQLQGVRVSSHAATGAVGAGGALGLEAKSATSTVWVASHRRSGTHMMMDILSQALEGDFSVVKMMHLSATEDEMSCECLRYLKANGRFVHTFRDVRDVLVSVYYYQRKFGAALTKGLSIQQFLRGDRGARDSVLRDWVKTTSSWLAQPDVLSLRYEDTVQGFPHTYNLLSRFTGLPVRTYALRPREMISTSNAVWRGAGKGAQGWTSVMSNRQGLFIEELARNMTHEFLRRNDSAICSAQDSRADTLDQAQAGEDWRWVGGGKTGVRVPHFCPKSLEVAKVVVTKKLNLVRPEHQYAPVETRTDRKKRT